MMRNAGIDAIMVVSTDWGNLNKTTYYLITVGKYDTEDAAEAMLDAVLDSIRSFGYSSAYVKYSGEYVG